MFKILGLVMVVLGLIIVDNVNPQVHSTIAMTGQLFGALFLVGIGIIALSSREV